MTSAGAPQPAGSGVLVAEELNQSHFRLGDQGTRDEVIHWWCQKTLDRFLSKLRRCPNADPFLEPLPWEELGLDDYLDVIHEPVDLQTIGVRLADGSYEKDGFIDPELFWEDVSLCWENCKQYYDGEEDSATYELAESMKQVAEKMEDEFWEELDAFESSLRDVEDGELAQAKAVVDVGAATIQDGAAAVSDILSKVGDWWWGNNSDLNTPFWQPRKEHYRPHDNGVGVSLREHYEGIIFKRFRVDVRGDLDDIERELHVAFDSLQGIVADIDQEDLEDEDYPSFPGKELKVPLRTMFEEQTFEAIAQKVSPPYMKSSAQVSPDFDSDTYDF